VLQTLVDSVDARPAVQSEVPAGNGTTAPVALISVDKYLPGQHPSPVGGPDRNVSVAR
jgi:serine/threonine-protein kinase RsbW